MNKAQLIDRLSAQLGSKKAATEAVDGVIDTITRAVASGEKVAITGFGVFEKVARPARVGRNPRTGATVKIKKTSVPKFKAGQSFKDVVSGAKKLPKVAASTAASAARAATGTSAKKAAPAKKASTAKKSTAKKATGTKSAAGRTLATKKSATPAKKTAAKKLATKTTAKKSTAKKSTAKKSTARKR